jgi:hypothetical protein
MAFSARARPKGRRSHSAPPGLYTTALRLDSTGLQRNTLTSRKRKTRHITACVRDEDGCAGVQPPVPAAVERRGVNREASVIDAG